jgi:hypothetical protein
MSVCELQPLIFAIQVVYEHGEPCWNDIDRIKLLIQPPVISGNPTCRAV